MKIDTTKIRTLVKARGLTNTQLAAGAGITRQALQGMLRADQVAEVRMKTVTGLTKALRLPDASLLSPDPLVGYKAAVAKQHDDLFFRGLGLPTTESRKMDDLYVPIRVRVLDQKRNHDCQSSTADTENKPPQESLEITVAQCIHRYHRALISGDPGSGKTTALQHAARKLAQGMGTNGTSTNAPRLPLMVRLVDFAKACEQDADMTLVRFVVTRTLPDASPEYWSQVERDIRNELERGTCLVLFDGLDEVGGDSCVSDELRKFVGRFGNNQFVLTSRIVALDAAPWQELGFDTFRVARWREADIEEFARLWYAGRPASGKKQPKRQLNQRADEFTALVLSQPALREIASNPLMLTILAALHHANATLPRRRIDLYAKIVEVMLETWEASKREAKPGDPLHGIALESREFGWLLAYLALEMQRDDRLLRPRWWVIEFVQQFLRDQMALNGSQMKEQSERVVRYLCERTGLLVERGDGVFGFWHRTFQEYFAARGLLLEVEKGNDIVTLLRPYLFHPRWEEVVVHVAASLSAPRATNLVGVILDDPDPAGRFLRRGQLLALRCLADGAAVADRALLGQIFSDGDAIGRSGWLGITFRFIRLLKRLRGVRHETEAQRTLSEIEEAAKRDLPEDSYFAVYLSSHDLPKVPTDVVPGTVYPVTIGGRQLEFVSRRWEKRIEDPEGWFVGVSKSVRDRKTDIRGRIALVSLLGDEAETNDAARRTLKELLVRDRSPRIRASSAGALGQAAAADPRVAKLLLDRLEKDTSDSVRERCAEALCGAAPKLSEVRARLEELCVSGPESVRAGAARGLWRLNLTLPEHDGLRERFLTTIANDAEPTEVRRASIWAVASLLGRGDMAAVDRVVENCLDDDDPIVSLVAHRVLAEAIVEGRKKWSHLLVEKIKTRLLAVRNPCCHLFDAVTMIVAMNESRGEWRLKRLLGDALTPFGELINVAFVFGSVARLEQIWNSDIDLMIIGEVRLKELAAALQAPEKTLGRTVNPVLFSMEKFREQYREGNPFLFDVVRKEKVFLKGTADELRELVADRSPE